MTINKFIASLLLGAAGFSAIAGAQDARGLFVSPANGAGEPSHPALRFRIDIDRNGHPEPVDPTYRFHSGDKFRFTFELNSSRYIYIVNRSIEGDPDQMGPLLGTKGLNLVNQSGAASSGAPKLQLLWPPAGRAEKSAGNQPQTIPGPTQFFEFDANPGLEKISFLISPYPIDPGSYFPSVGHRRPGAPAQGRADTNEDVLAQLNDLRSIADNTIIDPGASRGICVGDCNQYSAPRNPVHPFIVTVDLLHSR